MKTSDQSNTHQILKSFKTLAKLLVILIYSINEYKHIVDTSPLDTNDKYAKCRYENGFKCMFDFQNAQTDNTCYSCFS